MSCTMYILFKDIKVNLIEFNGNYSECISFFESEQRESGWMEANGQMHLFRRKLLHKGSLTRIFWPLVSCIIADIGR